MVIVNELEKEIKQLGKIIKESYVDKAKVEGANEVVEKSIEDHTRKVIRNCKTSSYQGIDFLINNSSNKMVDKKVISFWFSIYPCDYKEIQDFSSMWSNY